jgi:hypothetical protein
MTIESWAQLWGWFLALMCISFAAMSVWVSIQGAADIKSLLSDLKARHEGGRDTE